MTAILSCSLAVFLHTACINSAGKGAREKRNYTNKPVKVHKPSSSFTDTLKIMTAAAVFYQPDSIQLQKIKAVTEEPIFKGSMHEYFYQIRNAHSFLKQHWPHLKVVDVTNIRYLAFCKKNHTIELIDLDQYDPCGMFLFDESKDPQLIDMTNIDSQVPDYFSDQTQQKFDGRKI